MVQMMGRTRQPVTATAIQKQLSRIDGMHAVGGVSGLYLYVRGTSRLWILRYSFNKKRHDMTLSHFSDCSLEEARALAFVTRQKIRAGIDPLSERQARQTSISTGKTFKDCAEAYIKAQAPGWKNEKHGQQWHNTLETYAYPILGDQPIALVETAGVIEVLEPIWTTKNETASRLRGRIESVLDWAAVHKLRTGENPARWKGHLAHLLAPRARVQKREHHAALPYGELPEFMKALGQAPGMGARALAFAILTAARSGEVRGAVWSEFDLAAKIWTVPADRMKAGREHRVPLSASALALVESLPRVQGTDLIFPGLRKAGEFRPLSDMTLTAVLRRMGRGDLTAHGFRSSFRDWAAETTNYPSEMAEMALAHVVGNKVEAAYRRGDLFDKRRKMMDDWAAHIIKADAPT
jgi:integrase